MATRIAITRLAAHRLRQSLVFAAGCFCGLALASSLAVSLAAQQPQSYALHSAELSENTIAHEWQSAKISPRTPDDVWITNGMARYSALMLLENQSGHAAFAAALCDEAAAALAYDTVPLSNAGSLSPSSPEFQTLTTDKGAMIFHMLRGELGDTAFFNLLQDVLREYSGKMIDRAELEKMAEVASPQSEIAGPQNISDFFSQWLDSPGVPHYTDNYTIYRLDGGKGYRVIGAIDQDLDLFRMPVELEVESGGARVTKMIEVAGPSTPYTIDMATLPGEIRLDPDGWVLHSTPELLLRAAILRGRQRAASGDLNGALADYRQALGLNPLSSLAHYRIGETLFALKNYPASAEAFRAALGGDGQPPWTETWSHIEIGKIFDLGGRRDQAVNEYRLAIQTGDNAQGGVDQARMLLAKPYRLPDPARKGAY